MKLSLTRISLLLLCVCLLLCGCEKQETPLKGSAEYSISLSEVPEFDGVVPFVEIDGSQPQFEGRMLRPESFESYSGLDDLGRCGVAEAVIGADIMPTAERGSIGAVKPSGWQTVKYDNVDGKYLYNRCHLLGYQLTGENANQQNLITGTRYMNTEGMLPFENLIADYVKNTGNHVAYRVTPIFEGENLLASGVQMEALSLEDNGEGIRFNVYAYNAQPDIEIDYSTGKSHLAANDQTYSADGSVEEFVLNTSSKKMHRPDCPSVSKIAGHNYGTFKGDRQKLIDRGFTPCGSCNP